MYFSINPSKIEILNRIRKMIDFELSHEMTKGITFMEERIEYPKRNRTPVHWILHSDAQPLCNTEINGGLGHY